MTPEVLYKYASSSTTTITLESSKLRWSSPSTFNDVHEFQRMPCFKPTLAEAASMFAEVIAAALFDEYPIDRSKLSNNTRTLMGLALALKASGRDKASVIRHLSSAIPDADQRLEDGLRQHFENIGFNTFRVLCLTDSPLNNSMWGNYADSHKGCVLGFRTRGVFNSPFSEAQQVRYTTERPCVGSGLDFFLYGDTPELRKETRLAICFTKHTDWATEKEWRMVTRRPHEEGQLYGDYPFVKEELESITFGQRTPAQEKLTIAGIASERFPNVQLYCIASANGELRRTHYAG